MVKIDENILIVTFCEIEILICVVRNTALGISPRDKDILEIK